MAPSSSNKKRNLFDTVDALEEESIYKPTQSRKRIRQSKAAQSQVKLHGQLVQLRILLQRVQQQQQSNEEESHSKNEMDQLLQQLMRAQKLLSHGEDDEVEQTEKTDDESVNAAAMEQRIQKGYEKVQAEAKTVLNKRQDQVRLHSGLTAKATFALQQTNTFWGQVEATTSHVLMQASLKGDAFDDSKLYQHMLQDYLSADPSSSTTSNKKDSKSRSKTNSSKSKVDRKATKGRKLRYGIIPKLQHFCFPQEKKRTSNGMMDQDEWFQSLFGGVKNVVEKK